MDKTDLIEHGITLLTWVSFLNLNLSVTQMYPPRQKQQWTTNRTPFTGDAHVSRKAAWVLSMSFQETKDKNDSEICISKVFISDSLNRCLTPLSWSRVTKWGKWVNSMILKCSLQRERHLEQEEAFHNQHFFFFD